MFEQRPHKWTASTLGHGESMCVYCYGTNREIAVIGDMNHCEKAPTTSEVAMEVGCESNRKDGSSPPINNVDP